MLEVRTAVLSDKEAYRELWRICFGDSERFMDWFFSERFFPEYSSCLLEDGAMMSALQSYPLHVRIRNQILPASMLTGVSTHPERSGRGYMKQIFLHHMQRVRSFGIPIVFHTPAHLPTFFSRGHFPATDTLHLTLANAHADALPEGISRQDPYNGLGPLQVCYHKATARYSGCVSRTAADFAYKLRDYASDGALCLVRRAGADVLGYCVYYVTDNRVHAEECFALDGETLSLLLRALCFEAAGRELHVKLPPDAPAHLDGAVLETRPQGVMGIADVSAALNAVVGDGSYVFEVADSTVPQNAGVWDGAGKRTDSAPQIRLEAGRLGQFLCGYRSIMELAGDGEAEILDAAAARALDRAFPKELCFVADEY
ncbi:MAG TPA: GNAT family N-acetyltransferase [Feifaniaceae bacterium]|nr:GNAT family N-acetyltransferase [Feifaniaceae bacterium]